MATEAEQLERIFPTYLSHASKEQLAACFADRSTNHNYHAHGWDGPDQPIQGDGWTEFSTFDFESGDRLEVSGIVISNTCDIDASNASMRPRKIAFVPIIKLEDYRQALVESGLKVEQITKHLSAIRQQEKTEVFYVPSSADLPECLIMLDDVHSQPLQSFLNRGDTSKRLFRLNNFGFYMFLMKLSIHLTRFGEKLDRSKTAEA